MNDQPDNTHDHSETVRKQHLTARVPESVSRGVFSTGVILMTGNTEFVIDFLQNLGSPAQVVARVALPHAVLPSIIGALRTNLDNYRQRYGEPPELPRPPQNQRRPTVQEIYDELKLPDELLPGSYANGLMVGHSPSEFKLDFLTNLFPHSAVSCRVFVSVPQLPRIIESMSSNLAPISRARPAATAATAPATATSGESARVGRASGRAAVGRRRSARRSACLAGFSSRHELRHDRID